MSHPADQVKGSQEFYGIYQTLTPGSAEKCMVDSGLDELEQNMTAEEKNLAYD